MKSGAVSSVVHFRNIKTFICVWHTLACINMLTCRLLAFLCCWWLIKRWDFQKLLSFILNICFPAVALVSLKHAVSGYQAAEETFTGAALLLYHARRAFMPVTALTNTLHNNWQLRERQRKLSEHLPCCRFVLQGNFWKNISHLPFTCDSWAALTLFSEIICASPDLTDGSGSFHAGDWTPFLPPSHSSALLELT